MSHTDLGDLGSNVTLLPKISYQIPNNTTPAIILKK